MRPAPATMRRFALALGVALGGALFASSAAAKAPVKSHISYPGYGGTLQANTGWCPFDVTITILVGEVDVTDYFDADGNLAMTHEYFVQQDAFSANGKTLTGVRYSASAIIHYQDGVPIEAVAEGVLEKVPLPDGGLFMAAGRVNLFTGFALSPDKGVLQNVAGLCAALAP